MNYCTHCGAPLDGTINFCKTCGAKLDDAGTPGAGAAGGQNTPVVNAAPVADTAPVTDETATSTPSQNPPLTDRKKLAIILSAGVAVAALILVLVFTVFLSKPETERPLTVAEQSLTVAELLDLGDKYLLDLEYAQALVQFELVIEIEPMNVRAHLGVAESHIGLSSIDSAISVLRDGFAKFAEDKGFLTQTITLYEKIIAAEPLIAEVYSSLAETHMALDDMDAAIATLRRGLEALPDNTMLSEMLAGLLPVGGKHTIAVGFDHCLAIKNDGSLWAWGNNGNGQLGDGTVTVYRGENNDRHTPKFIMDNVKAVAAGSGCSFAITTDGSLWAWGANSRGQLGDGTSTDRYTPVKIMDNVSDVAAGMAITTDGSLWTWGSNTWGSLGDGTSEDRYTPVKIMDNVSAIAKGSAVKSDGSLWGWGVNSYGRIGDGTAEHKYSPVKVMDNINDVEVGGYHTLAITTNGDLWSWGWMNSFLRDDGTRVGVLCNGTIRDEQLPFKVMENVSSAAAGDGYSFAITADGNLWAWGFNDRGQLGDGTITERDAPVCVFSNVVAVSTSAWHSSPYGGCSLAVTDDGSLWAWGSNNNGQLGDGTTEDKRTPIKIMDDIMMPRNLQSTP